MGETFLVNIDCSKILKGGGETQYTMFIDGTKMSIVFELVEWIRWMFSVEECIYLMYQNSVIHELEDIQVLSRLKNFEIKPCGQFHCVHKKTYRALLNNCNMFVFWNELKIHKYFLDKFNQMSQRLTESSDQIEIPKFNSFLESEAVEIDKNKIICLESASKKSLKKSSLNDSPCTQKKASFDNHVSANSKSSNEINVCFNNHSSSKENYIKNFEDSINFENSSNSLNKNFTSEISKSISSFSVSSPIKTEFTKPEIKKSAAKLKTEKHFSKLRPFSLGDILTNIRENFEKQKKETAVSQKITSYSLLCEEKDINEKMSVAENLFVEGNQTEFKKRQRTRRRKRTKAKSLENMDHLNDLLQISPACKTLKSSSNSKPNHIRFDYNDESNLVEIEKVENKSNISNENELEVFPKIEAEKLITVPNDECQSLLDSPVVDSIVRDNEDEMKCLENDSPKYKEEKLIDLDNPASNGNLSENLHQSSFGRDYTILDSLKEKFKNSVVIERFY